MPVRKMRVELFDGDGNRYTIAFEGQVTREKAVKLLDLVELLGGMPNNGQGVSTQSPSEIDLSKYDKIRMVAQRGFPLVWFSSHEIQLAYEQEYKEPVGLSTVATYLSRMTNKGLLIKSGASNSLRYKLSPSFLQASIKQKL